VPRTDPYSILVERIRQGRYPVGALLPSERSLAEELGVHRTTVQRCLARLAAEGLLERQRGCRPVVRQLVKTPRVAQVTALLARSSSPSMATPGGALIYGAQSVLRSQNHRLLFMSTFARDRAARQQTEHEDLTSLLNDPVGGIIIVPQDPVGSGRLIQKILDRGTAVVAADRRLHSVRTDYVGVDNAAGITMAVEYLVGAGHRRIGFVDSKKDRYEPADDRRQGFLDAMRRQGVPDPETLILDVDDVCDPSSLDPALKDYLAQPDRPTALTAVDDEAAAHTAWALERLGLRVPDDISIVGFDDERRYTNLGSVELTTIRQPFFDMGREAASLLLTRLRHPDSSIRTVMLVPSLVERTSVRCISNGAPAATHGPKTQRERK
jgi:DNA-binding LacI/PurR family transcriptional regulator